VRIDTLALRRLLHLLPMLIDSGEEKDVMVQAALMPRKEIRQHLFVRMAEMRRAVHVVDRRGKEIGTGHDASLECAPPKARRMLTAISA
jgi:hypothetical protein